MKKMTLLILALAMILAMPMTCLAMQAPLILADAEAQPGDTVYLALTLNESVQGNAMAVTYSFDESQLEALPISCTWEKDSILEDFNQKNEGIWASSAVSELKGTVCILAFRLKKDADFTATEVKCTLMIKNDSQDVAQYPAVGTIWIPCDHQYENWESAGSLFHSRTCKDCGNSESASHNWTQTSSGPDPADEKYILTTFTCTDCGGTKTQRTGTTENQPSHPTLPEAPSVTLPVYTPQEPTAPTQPPAYPTAPSRPNYSNGSNQGSSNGSSQGSGNTPWEDPSHDHSQGSGDPQYTRPDGSIVQQPGTQGSDSPVLQQPSAPIAVPYEPGPETTELHDHDHSEDPMLQDSAQKGSNAALFLVLVAALICGTVIFVKKKR